MRVLHGRGGRLTAFIAGVAMAVVALIAVQADPARTQGAPAQAKSADAFVDSIGINVHLGYAADDSPYCCQGKFPAVEQKLTDLGVRHIRDKMYPDDWQWDIVHPFHKRLADNHGIKTDFMVDPRYSGLPTPAAVSKEKMGEFKALVGNAMEYVEGPNELDLSGRSDWVSELQGYQRALYDAVKANGSTWNVPVIVGSLSQGDTSENPDNGDLVGDLSAYANYGNMRSYPGGNLPSDPGRLGSYWISGARKIVPADTSKQVVVTETGYHNVVDSRQSVDGQKGISEAAAAKYVPRLFLEYFNRDTEIARTYSYELYDAFSNGNTEECGGDRKPECNFGLLRNDGTEKPAYEALKNLIGLLEEERVDPAFTPGSLDYSLSGDTTSVHRTLLQKSGGKFYLVLWQEAKSYEFVTDPNEPDTVIGGYDVSVPPKNVTLNLSAPYGAKIYQPKDSSWPISQSSGQATRLDLRVPDHPLVVELTPDITGDTAAPTIIGKVPGDQATGVPRNSNVRAIFSEAIDGDSMKTPGTFKLEKRKKRGKWVEVAGTVGQDATSMRATFDPTNDLGSGRVYKATVTTGAKDASGNALETDVEWTFTTRN